MTNLMAASPAELRRRVLDLEDALKWLLKEIEKQEPNKFLVERSACYGALKSGIRNKVES